MENVVGTSNISREIYGDNDTDDDLFWQIIFFSLMPA
jgi:hypothetical protein